MTLRNTWTASLSRLLDQLRSESGRTPRLAILGVGNPFRSDDAAGILVARALSNLDCAANTEHVLVIEAGQAPENATWELRKFAPDLVLFVDAAEMRESPGAIQWIPEESIDGMSASTHSLPLSMLAHYLRLELSCRTAVLGIQARSNEMGEKVSEEVLQAVDRAAGDLDGILRKFFPHYPKAKKADRPEAKFPLQRKPGRSE